MAVQLKPRSNKQGLVDTTADLAAIDGRENYTVLVKDYGIFEWNGTGTANSIDIFAGKTGYWSLITNSAPVGGVVIKTYRAILNQTGTSAPTATVIENTLGGTVTLARTTSGKYTLTLNGAFTLDKTFIMTTSTGGTIASPYTAVVFRNSANVVEINTGTGGSFGDDYLFNHPIEILVYP
jgi:hypothetical protein